jgi:alkylhydroperoxidase/carboxymuconolactone decarboxylase family protein YurZ
MRFFAHCAVILLLVAAPLRALTKTQALKLFDRTAAKLELSTEQRSEIFFLLVRNQKEIRRLLSSEEAARADLRKAVAQAVFDEALVRERSCRAADAELAVSLFGARLYAEVWQKLDDRQRGMVAAAVDAALPRDELLSAAAEFAGGNDLYLTLPLPRR